jgi:hypothetical protein
MHFWIRVTHKPYNYIYLFNTTLDSTEWI